VREVAADAALPRFIAAATGGGEPMDPWMVIVALAIGSVIGIHLRRRTES
jgi:hypothetical protein